MQSYSHAVKVSKKFPSICCCNFFNWPQLVNLCKWSLWSNVVGDSAAESWSLYAQLGRETGGWKLGQIFNFAQLKTWNRKICRKLSQGIAGLLVGGGLGATAGTISLLGFKPEIRIQMIWLKLRRYQKRRPPTFCRMKQACAIVPQAAFFVGSALALAQVALSP